MQSAQQLIPAHAFLSLSRQQPARFSEPAQFELEDGTQAKVYAPGVISFTPANSGHKDIVLSCGIHGNETAPIEICDAFVQRILSEEIKLAHRVLFIFGNLPAMDIAERFVEENMNRLFSGEHSNSPGLINQERRRAKQLEACVADFYQHSPSTPERQRLHYDLHTAIRKSKNEKFAVYPYLHGKAHNKQQLMFMHACGVKTVLLSESPTSTFSYFSSRTFNAHAFTVELGQVKPFGENDMSRFSEAKEALHKLLTQQELVLSDYKADLFDLYRVNQVINKTQTDFMLHFADDMPNFSDFAQGELLAEETGKQYFAEHSGEAIVFPNANVALGQRALLTVVPTQI